MGAGSLCELFDEKYYAQLDGGILESFGRLFKNDLKLYIYPLLDRKTGELTTVENLQVAPELRKLYEYLVEKRLHRAARQLQPRLLVDLLARRDRADQIGRSLLERQRAGRSRRRHPPPRLLRSTSRDAGQEQFKVARPVHRARIGGFIVNFDDGRVRQTQPDWVPLACQCADDGLFQLNRRRPRTNNLRWRNMTC